MADLWLGLDVGTTAVKAAAYTADGAPVAVAEAPNRVSQAPTGEREQDMAAVWATTAGVLRALTAKIDAAAAVSLGVAAQGDGFWAVDNAGAPAAPAMLWNDTRAARDVDALTADGKAAAVGRGCQTALWAGTSGTLWRWLRQNDRRAADRVTHVMTCADWVGLKLTGEAASDYANASIPFLDFARRDYGPDQLNALDCADLTDRLLPPRKATERLGAITATAADETGLAAGLPVSVGTLDLCAMIVGMGMDRPGQTMMIMGTTAVVNILTDRLTPEDAPVGASVLHPTSDVIVRVLAPSTGASAFDWFARLHPQTLGGEDAGAIAAKLNGLVRGVPPGANGVTFLPYLSGERAPFVAADIRAAFHGLSAATTKAEMGRAVMEGAALSLRHCFEEHGGRPTAPVQLTGGGSKNDVWCQIIADVLQAPVRVSDASDQGLWGAACIGAAAAGHGEAVDLAHRAETFRTFDPNPDHGPPYDRAFQRYVLLSDMARAMQARLRPLQESDR